MKKTFDLLPCQTERTAVMDIRYERYYSQRPTQDRFPVHRHAYCELFFCMDGNGEYMVEGKRYPLKPGTMMLLRPGELHCPEIDPNHPYERCYVYFQPETIAQSIDSSLLRPFTDRPFGYGNYYKFDTFDAGFIQKCFEKIDETKGDPALNVQCNFYPVLYEVYKAFSLMEPTLPVIDDLVLEILEYINHNLTQDLSLGLLEQRFYMNKASLNQRFKKVMGQTIGYYILNKRLSLANQLLRDGESATKAAYSSGFGDYSSFYRAYVKKFSFSPNKTR